MQHGIPYNYGRPGGAPWGEPHHPQPPSRKSLKQKVFEARMAAVQILDAATRLFTPPAPPPLDDREYPLGFYLADILPGETREVVSRPQIVLRGERLAIPFDIARYFDVCDIKVGGRTQLPGNDTPLPAEIFGEHARGIPVQMETAVVAQDITLVVKNLSKRKRTFMGTVIGTAAQ